jgi:hypothetical protein
MHDSLMQRSPVYRELRSGSCQGIAIPGVTLGQKLAAMLLATTLTAVAIALAYLV